jgi:hypothetical protein
MIMDLRKHINGNFDASQLLKRLDTVQKLFSADHFHFSSPAAMFRAAILIAVVSFVVWKKCCAQATSSAHTPAPMPALQPMPQTQSHPQPQAPMLPPQNLPPAAPPAYSQQNPTFMFSKPTAPVRHERDSRQSPYRSRKISYRSGHWFSGNREKVPFSSV